MKPLLLAFAALLCLQASAITTPGIQYSYYEGTWTMLPDFTSLTAIKKGTTANFDLGVRNRDLSYGVLWEGAITLPATGDYTFETSSDDGSQLFIAGSTTPLVNNDGEHASWPLAATIRLSAGTYPIRVTFFQNGGGHAMEVYWSSNTGIARQQIPDNAFSFESAAPLPPAAFTGINNYYFSTISGDDSRTSAQAKNPATPWKTLGKLSAFSASLLPGDAVFFKRGDTFLGSLPPVSGLFYGSYGTGAKPVISGFTTLSGWTQVGTNLWEAPLNSGLRLNMLTINGVVKAPGRFPNPNTTDGGYLKVAAHSPSGLSSGVAYWNAPSAITTTATLPGSWVGAELVLRKNSYTFDRTSITGQSGTTLSYVSPSANEQSDQFGFFIQNSNATLDQDGEWYYNSAARTLRLYSTTHPSAKTILAATVEALVTLNAKNNITFQDLAFQGSDTASILMAGGAHHISFKSCDISYSGIEAIFVDDYQTASFITIDSCTINQTNSSAILMYGTSNLTLRHTSVKNSNLLPGLPRAGQAGYNGVYAKGSNNLFEYNTIDSCGGPALAFNGGSNIIARNNYINYFCAVVCDYGGIYTNGNDGFRGRKIIGNIITNGVGAFFGTDIPRYHAANGIYLDESANDVEVRGNSIYKMASNGIYIHQSTNNIITGNTIYDNTDNQISMTDDEPWTSRVFGNRVTRNIFIAKTSAQLVVTQASTTNDLHLFGSYDSNYYARPFATSGIMNTSFASGGGGRVYASYDLPGWTNTYPWDKNSEASLAIAPYRVLTTNPDNKFANPTFSTNASGVESGGIITWENKIDAGSIGVNSVSKTATMTGANMSIGSTVAGTTYLVRFSLLGSTNSENAVAYIRRWGGDYAIISEIRSFRLGTTRTECEFTFTATVSDPGVKLTIIAPESVTPFWFDNITAHEVTLTPTNLEDSIRFEYNATSLTKNVTLNGTYRDVKNNTYTNQVSLAPYSSVILFQAGTTTTAATPPPATPPPATPPPAIIPPANKAPIARAGTDVNMTLPTNSVTLRGNTSTDPDGTIVTYSWTKISGPTQYRLVTPLAATTVLRDMVVGFYSFKLTVKDNAGAEGYDTVVVKVRAKGTTSSLNLLSDNSPVANASAALQMPQGEGARQLAIYPNPAISTLNTEVNSPANGRLTMAIYNLNGVSLQAATYQKTTPLFRQRVNVSNLPTGVYYLEYKLNGEKPMIKTFIKQ